MRVQIEQRGSSSHVQPLQIQFPDLQICTPTAINIKPLSGLVQVERISEAPRAHSHLIYCFVPWSLRVPSKEINSFQYIILLKPLTSLLLDFLPRLLINTPQSPPVRT